MRPRKGDFMNGLIFFLIPVGLAATTIILAVGIYSLVRGGAFAKENANKLMRLRVIAQAATIALIALLLLLSGAGSGG